MSIVIDGTLGVSAVQDGIISESKLATGAVTDTKLTLTPNSQEVKDALNATGSASIYACRAWVNFNGTGTVAIRASGNVSSITDRGTGQYTVNFTTAMPDVDYCVSISSYLIANWVSSGDLPYNLVNTSVEITHFEGSAYTDTTYIHVAIFR